MKIRLDFVSNSSSSSFVILGTTMAFSQFLKHVEAAGWKREDCDDDDLYGDGTRDDLWEINEWLDAKTKGFLEVEGAGVDDSVDEVVVGAHPSQMEDSQTLKEFKQKIADSLAEVGIEASLKDIKFESGGSDASGMSWIGDCG